MAAVSSYKLTNGLSYPCIGLGTYAITGRSCVQSVATAIDLGYRLIDTASFYHNEAEVGEGVRQSSVPRDQVFVATKLYPNQFSHAARAIDEALRKLDLDYLDMMLLHHPAGNDVQAYRAIEDAIQAGKVRFAGISCYYQEELRRFLPQISVKPLLVQNEVHPFYQDTAVVDFIQKQGLLVQSWYPLGGRGYTQELFGHKTIKDIAAGHHKTPAQVILRWHVERGICPIPGSHSVQHLKENLEIFDFKLSPEEMQVIARLERHDKHDWY